jgi:arsenite-transporting ATPase
MRILLFTGKGGVGKTTIAAATALRAAQSGLRTLVCSTDPAHSLGDAFDVPLGDAPSAIPGVVGAALRGQQLNARARLEESWGDVREYMAALLDWAGADAVEAEELAVIPGLDEVFALADIRAHVESGHYDLLVVDCAPTAETVRLLSLPDVLGWYMQRVFPAQRNATRAVRPLLSRLVTVPIAGERVFAAVRRLYDRLDGVRDLLTDGDLTSARLVVNPERLVLAEARRTFTYLSLFGYRVDAIVANRIIPKDVTDPYFGKWKEIQAEHLGTIRDSFEPVPILTARLFEQEIVGSELLEELGAEVYGDRDASAILHRDQPIRVRKRGPYYVLSMRLPFVQRDSLDIHRKGDELYVRVGSYKRSLVLPHALQRLDVRQARFVDEGLEVRFAEKETGRARTAR